MNDTVRRTPLFALIALALSLFAVPLFASSPEYQIGDTAPTAAPNLRGATSVATDGTDFFVVWSDGRSANSLPGALIGTRVKRTGQILDPLGIRIASTRGYIEAPQVVWDGSAYVVIWTDTRYHAGTYSSEQDIHVARVDRDGRIVTAPRLLAEDAFTSRGCYAASNGNVTVFVYRPITSYPNQPTARVIVLDREANTLRNELLPGPAPRAFTSFAVAATPSRFVVTWSSDPGPQWYDEVINAVALTGDGHVTGGAVQVGSGIDPAIATDGTRFTVTSVRYIDREIDPESEVLSRTVSADLTQIGDVEALTSANTIDSVSLLWRGDRYEMITGSQQEPGTPYRFLSVELDPNGNKLASRTRGNGINPYWISLSPVAATNGSDVLIAFTGFAGEGGLNLEIFAQLYRGSAPMPDVQQLLSWSGNAHANPRITSSAAGYFAAWTDTDGVYATRIDGQGRSLDGRGIRLTGTAGHARVAFDGTNYVAAWLDYSFIGVRYIAPATGATVAEVHIPVVNVWEEPALAASADATYVVFTDDRVRAVRIPHATHTPDPVPLAVSPENMIVNHPAAAWNGSTLLIVWQEVYYPPRADPPLPLAIKVHGARVTGGLSLLDPAPLLVAEFDDPQEFGSFGIPSLASNGEDWLMVTDLGPYAQKNEIVARRVLRSGMVEGTGITTIGDGFAPDVAWDGARYAVAFKGADNQNAVEPPIVLGSVSASGALVPMRHMLVATNAAQSVPSVARAANGAAAVAYTKLSFAPEHTGVERSYFRVMDAASRGRVVRR